MKSGIQEILASGQAPGVITGQRPFDQKSVFHKAPKAIAEMERTPRYKHGPNHSARDISKLFGMSPSFIKETWSKPLPKSIACVLGLFLCLSVNAGQLQPGEVLVDGQTVHASDLNNMVGNAVLLPGAISGQPLQTFGNSDYFLLYSTVNGALYKQTVLNVFQSGSLIQLLPSGSPVFTNADMFPFYSAGGTNQEAVTYSNLVNGIASNLNPAYVRYSVTNPASGTNNDFLPLWSGVFSGFSSNVQPFSLWWSPNGVPYEQPLSNIEKSVSADLGTNWSLPYVFTQIFNPWTVYGTNVNFTNAWGTQIPFAITNFTMPGTNLPTLVDTDSLPIYSTQQGSNTTATLLALYRYMTNKNALPPYTIARIQFSGIHVTETVTNMSLTTGICTNIADAANWTTPTAVSFLGKSSQMPTTPLVQSNTVYYALLTNTTPIGFQLYTNYTTALARTNQIVGNGVTPSLTGTMYWLTNFTCVNADAIQLSTGTSIRTAVYQVVMRTTAADNKYYVTMDLSEPDASTYNSVKMTSQNAWDNPTTSGFAIVTRGPAAYQEVPLIHVLIQPQ